MMMRMRSSEKGFTLIELMIVVAIIGILAAIAIPNFLNLKDKALFGTAKANVDVLRSALAAYAADDPSNKYPVGTDLTFGQLRALVPEANMPAAELDAKFVTGTFNYTSADGFDFTITVNVTDRNEDTLTATPSGITPSSYPW